MRVHSLSGLNTSWIAHRKASFELLAYDSSTALLSFILITTLHISDSRSIVFFKLSVCMYSSCIPKTLLRHICDRKRIFSNLGTLQRIASFSGKLPEALPWAGAGAVGLLPLLNLHFLFLDLFHHICWVCVRHLGTWVALKGVWVWVLSSFSLN